MSLETSPGALGCPTLPMWHSRHYTVDVRHSYINVAILFMRGTWSMVCPSRESSGSQAQRNDCDRGLVHREVASLLD